MKNSNTPAYPVQFDSMLHAKGGVSPDDIIKRTEGLTKREYFAGKVMQGLINDGNPPSIEFIKEYIGIGKSVSYSFETHYAIYISKMSVSIADALLAELEKTEPAK